MFHKERETFRNLLFLALLEDSRKPKLTQSSELNTNDQDESTLTNDFIGNLLNLVDFVLCDRKQERQKENDNKELKKQLKKISKNKNINQRLSQSRLI